MTGVAQGTYDVTGHFMKTVSLALEFPLLLIAPI